ELENAIGRATVFALPEDGELLLPAALPPEVRGAATGWEPPDPEARLDLRSAVLCLKRSYLGEALRLAGGNKLRAARLLGVSRRGLYHLLREVGL
ncbi:MAG TPA: helix-turn-helix domain-containing protein, partial [Longimicrobiaceae bacterium]|nr:helix-turn-helix domain-containing protein [Longimicrobiaceae bacterium]